MEKAGSELISATRLANVIEFFIDLVIGQHEDIDKETLELGITQYELSSIMYLTHSNITYYTDILDKLDFIKKEEVSKTGKRENKITITLKGIVLLIYFRELLRYWEADDKEYKRIEKSRFYKKIIEKKDDIDRIKELYGDTIKNKAPHIAAILNNLKELIGISYKDFIQILTFVEMIRHEYKGYRVLGRFFKPFYERDKEKVLLKSFFNFERSMSRIYQGLPITEIWSIKYSEDIDTPPESSSRNGESSETAKDRSDENADVLQKFSFKMEYIKDPLAVIRDYLIKSSNENNKNDQGKKKRSVPLLLINLVFDAIYFYISYVGFRELLKSLDIEEISTIKATELTKFMQLLDKTLTYQIVMLGETSSLLQDGVIKTGIANIDKEAYYLHRGQLSPIVTNLILSIEDKYYSLIDMAIRNNANKKIREIAHLGFKEILELIDKLLGKIISGESVSIEDLYEQIKNKRRGFVILGLPSAEKDRYKEQWRALKKLLQLASEINAQIDDNEF